MTMQSHANGRAEAVPTQHPQGPGIVERLSRLAIGRTMALGRDRTTPAPIRRHAQIALYLHGESEPPVTLASRAAEASMRGQHAIGGWVKFPAAPPDSRGNEWRSRWAWRRSNANSQHREKAVSAKRPMTNRCSSCVRKTCSLPIWSTSGPCRPTVSGVHGTKFAKQSNLHSKCASGRAGRIRIEPNSRRWICATSRGSRHPRTLITGSGGSPNQFAGVAQLVEQPPCKRQVDGSNPVHWLHSSRGRDTYAAKRRRYLRHSKAAESVPLLVRAPDGRVANGPRARHPVKPPGRAAVIHSERGVG